MMSGPIVRVMVPPAVTEPRGASWMAALAVAAGWAFSRLRQSLDEPETPAAPTDLLALAKRVESEMPELAVELRTIALHRANGC